MQMGQESFAALWNFEREIESGTMTVAKANKECLTVRNRWAKILKRQGHTVIRWTMPNQLRQYWSWNKPCGLRCPVYMLGYHK